MRQIASIAVIAAGCQAQIFLDEKSASEIVLRGCDSITREEKGLTQQDRVQLQKLTGLHFSASAYTFLIGKRKGAVTDYAVIMNEIGKSEPITFMVGVSHDGKAGEIALMVFRESRGVEVREHRFMRQFKGKRLNDPIRVNQDIHNYTGATLSSEAIAHGVKKALALVHHFYLKPALHSRATYVMGTVAVLKLYAEDESKVQRWAADAFAELRRLDGIFSSYHDSELARLNRAAAAAPVRLSDDMFELLELSLEYSRRYEGAFDVTVGPAVRAWGFLDGPFRVPLSDEQRRLRELVGADGVELDLLHRTVRFRRRGMELDFGGIAKGYAAEKVARLLSREGVDRGLMSLGESSLFSLGAPPGLEGWPVTMLDRISTHRPPKTIYLPPFCGLSTSGTYGRQFSSRGHIYSHLFDPRTAQPVSFAGSATAICRSGAESEAAAKAALILGRPHLPGTGCRIER